MPKGNPQKWLVTGAAGFIGSHLVQRLLELDQAVVGIDNFSNGSKENLEDLKQCVGEKRYQKFQFVEGDIRDLDACLRVTEGVGTVFHMAALGSVPRSIKDPIRSHQSNVDGTVNLLKASVDNKVQRLIFASSSSVYGDNEELPKKETHMGQPLSPYAATKRVCEIYGQVFHRTYGLGVTGVRFFNVFGARQNPDSEYAAVIPRWYRNMLLGNDVEIFGDGKTSRDFTFVENVVQGLMALSCADPKVVGGKIYNLACGETTDLNQLFSMIRESILQELPNQKIPEPKYRDFRAGDIKNSLADITAAKNAFGFQPQFDVKSGLKRIASWYVRRYSRKT